MGRQNYLKAISKTKAEVNINNLPSCAFIDAMRRREVCVMKILGREERGRMNVSPGAPDIQVKKLNGEVVMMARQDICNNFKHSSGRDIKMQYLSTGKPYIIYKAIDGKCKVFKLPNNCRGLYNGKIVKANSYVIAEVDEGNNMIKGNYEIVSPSNFRKMFSIPMQPIIQKYQGGKGSPHFEIENIYKQPTRKKPTRPGRMLNSPGTLEDSLMPMSKSTMPNLPNIPTRGQNKPSINISLGQSAPVIEPTAANSPASREPQYRFIAVARLVSMSNKSKLLGFMIMDNKTGEKRKLTLDQVKKLCANKSISNLMIVSKDNTGLKYLRGNGIVIENLPEFLV